MGIQLYPFHVPKGTHVIKTNMQTYKRPGITKFGALDEIAFGVGAIPSIFLVNFASPSSATSPYKSKTVRLIRIESKLLPRGGYRSQVDRKRKIVSKNAISEPYPTHTTAVVFNRTLPRNNEVIREPYPTHSRYRQRLYGDTLDADSSGM